MELSKKRDVPDSTPSPPPGQSKIINNNLSPDLVHSQPLPPQLTQVSNDPNFTPQTPGRPIELFNLDSNVRETHSAHQRRHSLSFTPTSTRAQHTNETTMADRTRTTADDRCPPWALSIIARMSSLENTVQAAYASTNSKLDSITHTVCDLKTQLVDLTIRVNSLESEAQSISFLPSHINEITKTVSFLSDSFDDIKQKLNSDERNSSQASSINNKAIENLQERIISQEERSMRDNLLFFGIPEQERENTEELLHDFIGTNMPSISRKTIFPFERVHRIGKRSRNSKPRPIVAKFSYYKDRECVRLNARDLKKTNYGIKEHYPVEILERRRALMPKHNEARDQKLYTTFHRDALQIDNKEYRVNKNGQVYQTSREMHVPTRRWNNATNNNRIEVD